MTSTLMRYYQLLKLRPLKPSTSIEKFSKLNSQTIKNTLLSPFQIQTETFLDSHLSADKKNNKCENKGTIKDRNKKASKAQIVAPAQNEKVLAITIPSTRIISKQGAVKHKAQILIEIITKNGSLIDLIPREIKKMKPCQIISKIAATRSTIFHSIRKIAEMSSILIK